MICHDSVLVQFTPIFARDWTKIGPKTARSRRLDHDQKSSMKRGRHPRFGRTTGANRSDRPAVSLLIAGPSNPNCRGSWTSLCKLVAAVRTRVGSTQRRRDRGERQGGRRARICADFSLPSSCLTPAQAYLADVCSAASPTAMRSSRRMRTTCAVVSRAQGSRGGLRSSARGSANCSKRWRNFHEESE